MTTWTLILLFQLYSGSYGGGQAPTSVAGFSSEEACHKSGDKAASDFHAMQQQQNVGQRVLAGYYCVEVK